jgi:hypothetical protein
LFTDQAQEIGMDADRGKWLMPIIGIGDFAGKVITGVCLTAFPRLGSHSLSTLALFGTSAITLVQALFHNTYYTMSFAFLFGFFSGEFTPYSTSI